MFDRFFVLGTPAYAALWAEHDRGLVALSILTAVLASVIAMQLASLARRAETSSTRRVAHLSGALSLGGGVWAMHFIGMLAFDMCAHGTIAPSITAISMLPSVLASWIALNLLIRRDITLAHLVIGGVLVGAGIGTMHYVGMAASQWSTVLRYDPIVWIASVLVAVLMAILALWVRFGLERVVSWPPLYLNSVAGVVMGLAISGMHYTGMAALRFTRVPEHTVAVQTLPLALGIAAVMAAIGLLVVAINAGLVYWRLFRQLQQSESRQRAIANTAVDGMVVFDARGVVKSFSVAAERILGWAERDVIGRDIALLLEEHDRSQLNAYIQRSGSESVDATVTGKSTELQARHQNGSRVPVRVSLGRVQWGSDPLFVGFVTDLRHSQAMQRELERTVGALDRALAVIEFDIDGTILTANENYLKLMGYELSEVVGQHHRMFCDPAYVASDAYTQFWSQLRSGDVDGGEYMRLDKQGRPVWIQASYSPLLDSNGVPAKVVKFASDLSERRRMEQELRGAKERAEQAAAARSSFLANMSHEIRTPMNAIIGFTDVLLTTSLDAQQRRQLGTVNHAARSMLRLLNDILDTAKLEKGAVELEFEDFSLESVCEQILASLRIQASRKGLSLEYRTSEAVPKYLRGDALRFQQILLNLLGNAIKFTERGHVSLLMDYVDGALIATVRDTGIGIAASQLQRIFDPFAQADASTTRQFGGTGLGTTIARQLCELMQGTIEVESELGVGTSFTVRIPFVEGQAVERLGSTDIASLLPPLHVLAVDDVPHNLELLEHHLQRGGHTVTLARSGEEAVAHATQLRYDVVLMDLQMPGMDGLEATRRIRVSERERSHRPVPIIALSASVLEQDRRNARAAGMDGFANKPLEPNRLFREIGRLIGVKDLPTSGSYARVDSSAFDTEWYAAHAEPVVDWHRAQRLWGRSDALFDAGRRLLADFSGVQLMLAERIAAGDFETIGAEAHRLRGASGNVGFVRLESVALELERAAARKDGHGIATVAGQWPTALQDTQTEFSREASEYGSPAGAGASNLPAAVALDAASREQVSSALHLLTAGLERAELNQSALDALAAVLPPDALTALQDAIDRFDFDSAQGAAGELHAALIGQ